MATRSRPASSCRPTIAPKEPKLSAGPKLAFDLLKQLIATDGKPPAEGDNIPPSARVCSAVSWREQFYNAYPSTTPDTKQKAYVRAMLKLQELHLVELWGTWAWRPDMPDMAGQT